MITGYNADNKLAYLGNYFGDPSHFIMVTDAVCEYNSETEFIRGIHLYDSEKTVMNNSLSKRLKIAILSLCAQGLILQ